ncbi:TetR family transcriptional regulator [Microbaculum marinum]|uniref:TetR family transcriptional regulator n=1 Tax=Microbaculum marinum TaxID=1764581 RepID=A0AAW9RVW0_9HYPH
MSRRAQQNVFDRPRDHQIKRDAVLRVAAEMFNKRGYAATSLEEIAGRFNISKTALYYYVGTKPVVLQECYEQTLDYCESVMAEVTASNDCGLAKIERYVRGVIVDVLDHPCAIVHEFASLPPESMDRIHARARQLDTDLLKLIEEGIADGSIVGVPPKLTELLLMGAINWIQRWYNYEGENSLDEIADCFIAMFLGGLKPRP